jgi:hypothetical protein
VVVTYAVLKIKALTGKDDVASSKYSQRTSQIGGGAKKNIGDFVSDN